VKLEDLTPHVTVRGLVPDANAEVVAVTWGSDTIDLVYRRSDGQVSTEMLFRDDEARLELVEKGRPWSFDADGHTFRLAAEAYRIHLAHLFDPVLAVHTSPSSRCRTRSRPCTRTCCPPATALPARRRPRRGQDDHGRAAHQGTHGARRRAPLPHRRPGSLTGQWQDELWLKFDLPFDMLTNEMVETAAPATPSSSKTNSSPASTSSAATRTSKPSSARANWDLIIVDEAHKMSATFFGGEFKYTKRYRLGERLGGITRHLLLMTATPHNGKEEDFQLFLGLLDPDRFEGRSKSRHEPGGCLDLMRRMIKEPA
jgi:hypothetical protein